MITTYKENRRINRKTCARCGKHYELGRRGNDEGVCPPCSAFLDEVLSPEMSKGITEWFFRTAIRIDFTPGSSNKMPSYKELRKIQKLPLTVCPCKT